MTVMSNTNDKTIQSYDTHVQEYIDGTIQEVSGTVKDWLDATLQDLPKDAHILEFGSAFGRDAKYIQDLGYSIECTDATKAFVDLLQSKGFNARMLNAITDEIPDEYNLVLANAVLLHFTRDETAKVLQKVFQALKPGGTFAFTLKQGEGEEWTDSKLGAPRFFCYWTEDRIDTLLKDVGFSEIAITADQRTKNAVWLQGIAVKSDEPRKAIDYLANTL